MNRYMCIGAALCAWVWGVGDAIGDGLPCAAEDLVGAAQTPGIVSDVELAGAFAVVVDLEFGVYVFDISNPSTPTEVAHFADPDLIDDYRHLQVVDDRVYVGVRTRRDGDQVLIFDISMAGYLTQRGSVAGPLVDTEFQVVDGHMYFAFQQFFTSFDVSDPTMPVLAGEYNGVNFANAFSVIDQVAYIADQEPGSFLVRMIDVSDPSFSDPTSMQIGVVQTDFRIDTFETDGDRLFVGGFTDRKIGIYDIQNPQKAELLGVYEPLGYPSQVRVDGHTMSVTSYRAGYEVVNIDDPSAPELVGLSGRPRFARDVEFDGRLMYGASEIEGLQVFRAPTDSPALLASKDLGEFPSVQHLDAVDGHVYAAFFSEGLKVFDVRGAGVPIEVGTYTPNGEVFRVRVEGATAYLSVWADEEEMPGVHIVDISDPTNPEFVSYVRIGLVWRHVVKDQFVYAVSGESMYIIDASDPAHPVVRSETALHTYSVDTLAIGNGVLFAGSFNSVDQLTMIDVSNPDHPEILSEYEDFPAAYLTGVGVSGQTVYVTTSESEDYSAIRGTGHPGGLYIFDASDPTQIALIGLYENRVPWGEPVVEGDRLFVSSGLFGLMQFDVFDPASPRLEGAFFCGPGMTNVAIQGDQVFVANSSFTGSLYRLDASESCSRCDADLNGDGGLHHFDVGIFISLYLGGDLSADFNFDGQLNFFDVAAFIARFNTGCQ